MTNEEAIKWLRILEENEGNCPEGVDYAEFDAGVTGAIQRAIDIMVELDKEPHSCWNCEYWFRDYSDPECNECIDTERGGSKWKRRTSE